MVVIGRAKGEPLYNANEHVPDEAVRYADRDTVLELASKIAGENTELMRRLA